MSLLLPKKLSLRTRLFVAMILMLVLAGLLILGSTTIQYESQRENYHLGRLIRKEAQLVRHLNFLESKYNLYGQPAEIWGEYAADFEKITSIHNVQYSLFSLDGKPLFTFHTPLKVIANDYHLEQTLIDDLFATKDGYLLEFYNSDIDRYHASYRVLRDDYSRTYGILFFPYFEDISFSENELNTFLDNLYQIYIILLLGVVLLAYFLSKFVTRSLEAIRLKMDQTGLTLKNEKIYLKNATKEIDSLVNSYNKMIDDLAESAEKLARSEREQAWQEMAKQVAHEIKNPLTPMRLTVQSFHQKFDPNDPESTSKMNDFAKLLIQQIDTMSEVANTFSDFSTLPMAKLKKQDLVEVTQMAVDIFQKDQIIFTSNQAHIYQNIDKTQWIRVLTNLIQNSLQSVPSNRKPQIGIQLVGEEKLSTLIITDNGNGIPEDIKEKIFEPKFTTKTAGMGLGLGIVKNIITSHGGSISYVSTPKKGTTFTILLPYI